ncbi:hypothetical protein Rsub_00079 [Raphidocelis subcapitata]|uniref:Protein kinase domain-containing protein n=1 Tax=Raphidocelis subcapitata TaxID=307507 RepID=A0A2V0NJH0_9CHLO|nr:hypothetical protein Rsub_00079 [Raphidocelis subcapitata]|eukprot:GBF87368.1 hypothetical protein Rsub_00079 [Raphidocelis subcapitata]
MRALSCRRGGWAAWGAGSGCGGGGAARARASHTPPAAPTSPPTAPPLPSAPHPGRRRRRATAARAAGAPPPPPPPGGPEDGGSSIDELAAQLSRRAAELRASSDPGDLLPPDDAGEGEGEGEGEAAPDDAAADEQRRRREQQQREQQRADADAAAAAAAAAAAYAPPAVMPPHDGGFTVTDFRVFKQLGQLGVASLDSSDPAGGEVQPVFVYAARYESGLPFEGPATIMLKEYQAPSTGLAANEALVQGRLLGPPPERKWQAAVADASPDPPIVQLLGWLSAPPSDAAYEITGDNADAIWLVYRFEGLKPLSVLLPRLQPPQAPPGLQSLLFGGRAAAADAALAGRHRLLRSFAERLLLALSFCHRRGVAHCCLGTGSVQCSGLEDRSSDRVIVKLDNWGLAKLYPGPLEAGGVAEPGTRADPAAPPPPPAAPIAGAAGARRSDLQAAGLLLVEAFVAATAGGEAAAALGGGEALRRLLFEVFHDDVNEFRAYCEADEALEPFVEFADSTGAWDLLSSLLQGDASAGELLEGSVFFSEGASAL